MFLEFLSDYKIYLVWLGSLSFIIFIFSLLTIKWLVALIPSDYFIKKNNSEFRSNYPIFWLVSIIIKNEKSILIAAKPNNIFNNRVN